MSLTNSLPATLALVLSLALLPAASRSQLSPEWITRVPVDSALTAGIAGIWVEPDGRSFITGISGSSSNTDIQTVALAADGSILWEDIWDGPETWHDQSRGITMGPNGVLYVVGNTPGPTFHSNVLVLAYDGATGILLDTIQYSSAPGLAEHGGSIAVDAAGNLYVGGGTVGDGADVMVLKFDTAGDLAWKRTWDGPAASPFSGDSVDKILLDPAGDPVVALTGVMSSLHPDYVVIKYAADDGATLWESNWGVSGGDFPRDMEIDAQGDIYLTGIGIDFIDKISTLKFRGTDGALEWQFYDSMGNDHSARGLALDGMGGVLITGTSDPEGDQSNFNDQFFTIKRDAATGAQLWTHVYGDTCVGCFDVPSDVRTDPEGNAFVAGSTSSPPYSNDVILFVLDNNTGLEIDRGEVFNTGSEIPSSGALRFDAAFNLYDGGGVYNANTGAVDMSVTRWSSQLVGGNGIPCTDTVAFQARCRATAAGNRLQVRLTLSDSTHDGEAVTIDIDGAPFVLDVSGSRAQTSINGATSGPHTLELADPAGCFPPVVRTCPG